jgi:hypothetical protein
MLRYAAKLVSQEQASHAAPCLLGNCLSKTQSRAATGSYRFPIVFRNDKDAHDLFRLRAYPNNEDTTPKLSPWLLNRAASE